MADDNVGKINLIETMNMKIKDLYKSSKCSDALLVIGDTKARIFAHRSILGAQCEYFEKLFTTPLNELHKTEFELDEPLEAFQIILKYFYTGEINLIEITDIEILIQLIDLVEKYCLHYLKPYFENYCNEILVVENACLLLAVAKKYNLEKLETKSFNLIEKKSDEILASESFKNVPKEVLEDILTRETFYVSSEIYVFNAIYEWSKQENRNIETVIHLINFQLIPSAKIIKIRNLGTLTAEKLLDVIEAQKTTNPIKRGIRELNTNVATSKYYAQTIEGFMASELLNGNSTLYDDAKGYTRHTISKSNENGIIVELGQIFCINHLKILLWDCDDRSYSYIIKISTDKKKWEPIIDFSTYLCRSWQNLYFPAKNVKYIQIVGTHCTINSYFDIVNLEAYYMDLIPKFVNGFIIPKTNVALIKLGALVVEGESYPDKNGLITGDENIGYTCIGVGKSILIKLNQPYQINLIKISLYKDHHSRRNCYLDIKTSLNNGDWEEVVKNGYVSGSSSSTFNFSSKSVLFIKIIGISTYDGYSGSDVTFLGITHFECLSEAEK